MRHFYGAVIFVVILFSLNYSYALTPEQIIRLKQAGVEDKTIRMMIQQEREAKEKENAADLIGTREVRDSEGNAVVIYSTGKSGGSESCDPEREKADKAWKMLQNTIIDNRK